MKIGKRGASMLAALLVVLVVGGVLLSRYWIYIPGMLAELRDPVQPNRDVVWEQGPAEAAMPAAERAPNIVFILVDDLGFNDLSFSGGGLGGGTVQTPNIDSLGREGVIFANGYAGNATCAPSRAAIMTGRYATRFGFEFTPAPKAFQKGIATFNKDSGAQYFADREKDVPEVDAMSLPADEVTIAELLKDKGYHNVMLGKWHLGGTDTSRPERRGFDEFLGFIPGASMFLPRNSPDVVNSIQDFDPIDRFLWANLPFAVQFNGSERFEPSGYMTDYFTDEAVKAIEANRNRPFFMYLAYNAPHTPLQALKSDYDALSHIENHTERVYAAMVVALDRGVGKIKQALRDNGLEENTIVIFTSDNGGAGYVGLPDLNKPYRGWKASFFEGGIHVPFFMKWPARIAPGAAYDRPVAHVDIFSTVAAAAGAVPAGDRVIDGINLIPQVTGANAADPGRSLYWRSGHYKVLLSGGWKLQTSERPQKNWLYNLDTDPTERNNLADAEPERLAAMMAMLAEIDARQSEPAWPALIEAPIMIDRPLGGAPRGPEDEYVFWAN
ncbi:sulfatase-like hydrolase/transferase [Parvibaculum sp.]|uniref:sulfatase-like hydrolase/transferase n=1 Tax=Parvibaculum sp. TaxID=2024848 RepID=UPI0027302EDA|nr:sulfatase-like hydrolase/transferase [Parvibaculum sp.]MDP1627705.1 sulfatase-like hydrolase/transferase [Parvibaculum sp.]MDP2150703.1 sulfatase-like hydrolase/transferase [Parvibaculum sp.]MDP3328024.1 sulfatase-like hydrolase/transferase [Parvibaculum sp.]